MLKTNESVVIKDNKKSLKNKSTVRKSGFNRNKNGSIRNINGKIYIDFYYLDERVRESAGLSWNKENAKHVREQLDKIIVKINENDFYYAEVFPKSKKAIKFTEKEALVFGRNKAPDQVFVHQYIDEWYKLLKGSGRVTERTLLGYKSYINLYIKPFFGKLPFSSLNKSTFDEFVLWARKCEYKGKPLSNNTLNKIFVPLKKICKDVAIKYKWGNSYNPFFGFTKLPETDPYEKILPFSLEEQNKIIGALPLHWKPYFLSAFCIGLRQGEQHAIKISDINWTRKTLSIKRAITRNEKGEYIEGNTKNRHSRRVIKLTDIMLEAFKKQNNIYENFGEEYFFCSTTGNRICPSNLRGRVWIPALKKVDLKYRELKQTRHSFATNALSCGENPLWIAKVMGHRNSDMIIKVYSKYIKDAGNIKDGNNFDNFYNGIKR